MSKFGWFRAAGLLEFRKIKAMLGLNVSFKLNFDLGSVREIAGHREIVQTELISFLILISSVLFRSY